MARSRKPISKTARKFSVKAELRAILGNRIEGAARIEIDTSDYINKLFSSKSLSASAKVKLIGTSLVKIRSRFNAMANIVNLCDYIDGNLENIESLSSSLKNYRNTIDVDRTATIHKAASLIGHYPSLFTLSNSSMVGNAILMAYKSGWRGQVFIIESRPKNEGTLLAEKLARAGLRVTLGVDLMMAGFVAKSGAVFLGSDAVTETCFVNKIGSSLALELADKLGKPVYVLADKSKIISDGKYAPGLEANPVDEITSNRKIEVINIYFERVKPSGKVKYISGHKLLIPKQISGIIAE